MKLAIFTDQQSAVNFSDKIHNHLTQNRPRYNAVKWSEINKSDKEEKFMVKIPYDFQKWPVKLDVKAITSISAMPVDWKTINEINIKPIKK